MRELPVNVRRERQTTLIIPSEFVGKEFVPKPGMKIRATVQYFPPAKPSMDDPLGQFQDYLEVKWVDDELGSYGTIEYVDRPEWRAVRALRKDKDFGKELFDNDPMLAEAVFEDDEVRAVIALRLKELRTERGRE